MQEDYKKYDMILDAKIKKNEWLAIIVAVISYIYANLFAISNMIFNDDTIMRFASEPKKSIDYIKQSVDSFRPFTEVTERLFLSWYKTPAIAIFWNTIFIVLIAIVLIRLWEIKTQQGSLVLGILVGTSVSICELGNWGAVAYVFAPMLMLWGIYIVRRTKKIWGVICASIGFFWGLGIFPPAISVVLIAMVCEVFMLLYSTQYSGKQICELIERRIIVMCIGAFSLIVFCLSILNSTKQSLSSYQGLDAVVNTVESNDGLIARAWNLVGMCIRNLPTVIEKAYSICWNTAEILPQYKLILLLLYILEAIGILGVIIFCFRKFHYGRTIGAIACIILLPICIATMTLISSDFAYRVQHRVQWTILLACVVPIFEKVSTVIPTHDKFRELRIGKRYQIICISTAVLVSIGCYMKHNIDLNAGWYVSKHDEALCLRIISALDANQEFDYAKNPVYFIDISVSEEEQYLRNPQRYDEDMYSVGPRIDKETNLWCYGDASFRAHMLNVEGVPLLKPSEDIISRIKTTNIYEIYGDILPWDYRIFKFEDTDVYVIVCKTVTSNIIHEQ